MTAPAEGIPRTANLLACKQWWRVCFLYGDQEKYYRQIYGKAASQRIAMSAHNGPDTINSSAATQPADAILSDSTPTSPTLFPMKHPSRRRSKFNSAGRVKATVKPECTKPNSRVTVLDDPFLLGLHEHANLSEDSGIDNAAFERPPPVRRSGRVNPESESTINRELCNDLQIDEHELRALHLSKNRSGAFFKQNNESFSFSENESSADVSSVSAPLCSQIDQILDQA